MSEILCVTDLVNDYLIAEKRWLQRDHGAAFYPTDASMKIKKNGVDTVIGKCLRASYYSMINTKPSNPPGIRAQRIFKLGKLVEEAEINYYKELGIWYGSNVKFSDQEHKISGEADALIFNEEKENRVEGVELKSGYGPYFSKKTSEAPDPAHVMQCMLYIEYFKMPWHIVYIDRGEAFPAAEWVIVKDADGRYLACPVLIATGPESWVHNTEFRHLPDYDINEVYKRYNLLGKHLLLKSPPEREFLFSYPMEEVQKRFNAGLIFKSKFDAYMRACTVEKAVKATKNKEAKDATHDNSRAIASAWPCMYCSFKDHCHKDYPNYLEINDKIKKGEIEQIVV